MKVEVPHRCSMLDFFITSSAGERALSPCNRSYVFGELCNICMSDHASDIVSDNVNGILNMQMFCDEAVEVLTQNLLSIAITRMR